MHLPNIHINTSLLTIFLVFFFVLILVLKGAPGQGITQARTLDKQGQAFEDSIGRGRYALILSLVEHKSFLFSYPVASFAYPDVMTWKGMFVSIFPPGIAFILLPAYIAGSSLGIGQLSTGLFMQLIVLCNAMLLFTIARKLKLPFYTALLAAGIFLFGSNALAYSTVLSQHHISTLILLTMVLLFITKEEPYRAMYAFFLYSSSPFIDWPNLVILAPFFFAICWQEFHMLLTTKKLSFVRILVLLAVCVMPLFAYGIYNFATTRQVMGVAQLLSGGKKVANVTSVRLPFEMRFLPRGLVVLLVSPARGISIFFPVFVMSVFALFGLKKPHALFVILTICTVGANVLLYSLFGDTWGGPAFGPRYLIPSMSLLALLVVYAFNTWKKSVWFMTVFMISVSYSLCIAVLGALTTTIVPKFISGSSWARYVISYPASFLKDGTLGSVVYQASLHTWFTNEQYFLFVLSIVTLIMGYLVVRAYQEQSEGITV